MAKGINKVFLIGHLGADPDVRVTPNNVQVVNIRVATTESWKDRNTGEQQERTEWHRVVAFNRLAEIIGDYLSKGSQVYIEGKLQTRKWQDQSGNDRFTTEVICADMQMLGGTRSNANSSSGQQAAQSGQGNTAQSGTRGTRQGGQGQARGGNGGGGRRSQPQPAPEPAPVGDGMPDDFDDDIPF